MKTAIIYASKRGKTREMSEQIRDILAQYDVNSEILKAKMIGPDDLMKYDVLILGSSTWGHGDLQDDFQKLEREMEDLDLTGKYAVCFGPGNSRFPRFCEAVEILYHRAKNCNAKILNSSLKVDQLGDNIEDKTEEWAAFLASRINSLS